MRNTPDHIPSYVDLEHLDHSIQQALQEDIGSGDVTSESTIHPDTTATAILKAKQDGTVAGLFVAENCFWKVNPSIQVEWKVRDGSQVVSGTIVGVIRGNARAILLAERVALNYMQRMSGIATLTRTMVQELTGTRTKLLDTRKTLPGFRSLDKWSVLLGGGGNHRVGLYDMVLIKENHIMAAGGIKNALNGAVALKISLDTPIKIEIEVTNLDELQQVLDHGGADRVLLDNFVSVSSGGKVDVSRLKAAIQQCNGQIETEASGNVTLLTLGAIGHTGVDYVSSGALTHSVMAMDLSLVVTLDSAISS